MADAQPPIIVGVDFSANGRKALDAAIRLAKDLDTQLVVVHAFPDMKIPSPMLGDLEKQVLDEAKAEISMDEAMTLAEEWVQVARAQGADVLSVASEGNAGDLILQQADDHKAGLIVVGTHGRTGLRHLLMGSVAEDVVRRSKRPVMVVPSDD